MKANKYEKVLGVLYKLCIDKDTKANDKIAAAKLLLEYLKEGQAEGNDIRIVFDGANIEEMG